MLNQFLFFKVKILDGCNTLYPPCILLKKSSKTTRAKKPRLIALMDYCGKYFDPTSQCLKISQKSLILNYCYQRLSKIIEDYQRLLKDYRRLSKTIEDFQRLSKTIENYQRLLKTIKDYRRLLKTIEDYHRLNNFEQDIFARFSNIVSLLKKADF